MEKPKSFGEYLELPLEVKMALMKEEEFKELEDFEGDGHSLTWKCPACGHMNHEGDFWEVMPPNNGYHGEASLYCQNKACDKEFDLKFEVEYSVDILDCRVKEKA